MDILGLIMWAGVIIVLGGGGGAWLFFSTRKKKQFWTAKVYQLSEGTKKYIDHDGDDNPEITLNDLRPYCKDTLIKTEEDYGVEVYSLKTLGLTCKGVTADDVDVWGKDDKEVSVLLVGTTATILKKGYDAKSGNMLFKPMPRERIDLMKAEILIKKNRMAEKKGLLEKVLPYITVGIVMFALVGISYTLGESYVKVSENNQKSLDKELEMTLKMSENFREGMIAMGKKYNDLGINPIENDVGIQKINKSKTPSIE